MKTIVNRYLDYACARYEDTALLEKQGIVRSSLQINCCSADIFCRSKYVPLHKLVASGCSHTHGTYWKHVVPVLLL